MRKTTTFFLAALLTVSVSACDKKKTESEPPQEDIPVETVEDIEATTEPVYRVLTEDDFYAIDLNLNRSDKAPPTSLKSADISGLDFGERMSPCKAEEVRRNYGVFSEYDRAVKDNVEPDPDYLTYLEGQMEKAEGICSTPCKGTVENCAMLDDICYIAVNFDDYCQCHDSALFRFDPVTLEYKEVDTREGLDYHGCYTGLCAGNGRLYFYDTYNTVTNTDDGLSVDYNYEDIDDKFKTDVFCYDPATSETSQLFSLEQRIVSIYPLKNALRVDSLEDVVSDDGRRHTTAYVSSYRDYETGEEVEEPEISEFADYVYGRNYFCDGEPVEITGGYSGNISTPITVKTQYYTIETDFKQYTNIFAWKDRLCILNTETVSETGTREISLYTYDLEAMERTRIVLNGYSFSNMQKGSDGIFITQQSSEGWMHQFYNIYYLMPQLGTIFKLDKTDDYYNISSAEQIYYLTLEATNGDDDYYYYHKGKPKTLYWFDMKE